MATLRLLTKLSSEDAIPPFEYGGQTKQITQAVDGGGNPGKVSLTTSESVISFGSLTALGICMLTNTGSTNNAIFGPEVSGALAPCLSLKPGESFPVRLIDGVTYRAKAAASTTTLDIRAYED